MRNLASETTVIISGNLQSDLEFWRVLLKRNGRGVSVFQKKRTPPSLNERFGIENYSDYLRQPAIGFGVLL
uniref:Uncharacterized protein n=1 Tax=Nelumbo nucifera TaxID=4432 RepID=A0A822Y7R6_NELNU|nr:TPA_asm: hypothetical protein HUJ06_029945 [Nelumbo nucifera]